MILVLVQLRDQDHLRWGLQLHPKEDLLLLETVLISDNKQEAVLLQYNFGEIVHLFISYFIARTKLKDWKLFTRVFFRVRNVRDWEVMETFGNFHLLPLNEF